MKISKLRCIDLGNDLLRVIFLLVAVSFLMPASSLKAFILDSPEEYAYLDSLAIQNNADKGSFYHDYTRVYSNYFKEIRQQHIRFLEIGIYNGNSVRLWEAYFPNAELHFIDITSKFINYYSSRSFYHFMNQEDIDALQKFGNSIGGQFDIIIDDGGHTMKQQLNSLVALFPFVKSGGMYIIEDLHTSYWKEFGGSGTTTQPYANEGTTVHFLKELIDSVNAVGAKSRRANFNLASPSIKNNLTFWEKEVRSIHFYDSICIIFKR